MDVTFKQFHQVVNSSKYETIFLVAHHIEQGNGAIEFADGGYSNQKVAKLLIDGFKKHPKSFFPYICNIDHTQKNISSTLFNKIESFTAAYWYIPLTPSLIFICLWTSFMQDENTLLDAYQLAVSKVVNDLYPKKG